MAIPDSQLDTWARQGATQSAAALYQRIKDALESAPELAGRNVAIYLQGSYRNSTNIRGDSDVDVVAERQESFMSNARSLSAAQYSLHESVYDRASYKLSDFRADVDKVLRRAFPTHTITQGGKSIKIPRTPNNIPADIVPCLTYRSYSSFAGIGSPWTNSVDGIWLWDTKRSEEVVGYPAYHFANGVSKQQSTGNAFKPTVRIFKNLRCWLEDNSRLPKGVASSNHIECLLYNAPSTEFSTSHSHTFASVVNWLAKASLSNFVCVNGQVRLFGPKQWTEAEARQFLAAVAQAWNTWGQSALLRI